MEKIAIIDLGSNTARLVLVNMLEGGYFVVFDELKEYVRLAQDMETDGFLRPIRIEQTKKTLQMFRRFCDSNGVDKMFAYATAAVRRAKNQKSFLEEVAVTCGIKIRVLSEDEEGEFIYTGVINSMDIPKGFIMDIGGGSTKLVYYNRKTILEQKVLPFGAVTLTDMFKGLDISPEERAEKIEAYVRSEYEKIEWLKELDPDTQFIGVGGSFRNLGKISRRIKKYPLNVTHNYTFPTSEFKTIYDTIKTLSLDRTMKIKGLSTFRADTFPSALANISTLLEICGFENMTISGCGMREGAMFKYAVPTVAEKPISDVLGYSLNSLVTYFNMNEEHVRHIVDLSMQIFKQLKVLHKLPRMYVKVLRTAAMLHDSGASIKFYDHQKHSSYIILNSRIYGLTHREIVMASFIASAHKDGVPLMDEMARYRSLLSDEDVIAVRKLGLVLKIAESFDRSMSGIITGISCDVLGDSVIMKTVTETHTDCSLEISDALTCKAEFKAAYGKNLEII